MRFDGCGAVKTAREASEIRLRDLAA